MIHLLIELSQEIPAFAKMVISKIQVDYAKFVMIPVKIASECHQMIVLNAIHRLLGY